MLAKSWFTLNRVLISFSATRGLSFPILSHVKIWHIGNHSHFACDTLWTRLCWRSHSSTKQNIYSIIFQCVVGIDCYKSQKIKSDIAGFVGLIELNLIDKLPLHSRSDRLYWASRAYLVKCLGWKRGEKRQKDRRKKFGEGFSRARSISGQRRHSVVLLRNCDTTSFKTDGRTLCRPETKRGYKDRIFVQLERKNLEMAGSTRFNVLCMQVLFLALSCVLLARGEEHRDMIVSEQKRSAENCNSATSDLQKMDCASVSNISFSSITFVITKQCTESLHVSVPSPLTLHPKNNEIQRKSAVSSQIGGVLSKLISSSRAAFSFSH